jgi:hypothetical protein
MITVKNLLNESGQKHINILYVTKAMNPLSHTSADAISRFASSSGEKSIGVPDDSVHRSVKDLIPHFDHKLVTEPTIFNMIKKHADKRFTHVTIHHGKNEGQIVNDADKLLGKEIHISGKEHQDLKPATDITDVHPSTDRKRALQLLKSSNLKEDFEVGDYVRCDNLEGEIITLHPKYAIIISEGKEHRVWTADLELSENKPKRDQLYKEAFIYKGYRTKNFNRIISESFKEIAAREDDEFAVLECLKVLDFILGVSDKTITENYKTVRIQVERLKRYSKKIGASYLTESFISAVDEELFKYSLLEGINYSTTDRIMVAKVVCMMAGISINTNIDPTNAVNQAAIKLRTTQLTPQGWNMLGRLFKVVSGSGIKWNKDIFSNSIQKEMGI